MVALAPGRAYADCPSPYNGLTCGSLTPVCALASQVWTCNVTGGASTAILTEDDDSAVMYEAWGSHNGTNFCCSVALGNTVTSIVLNGSSAADTLKFTYLIGGNNLKAYTGTTITATINAGDCADGIGGSDDGTANYSETLHGDAGSDTINAGDGDDYCYGDAEPDTINGMGGADVIYGGTQDDVCTGGGGRRHVRSRIWRRPREWWRR